MPAPGLPVQPPNGPRTETKPKQKEMTKAERRELQERQRAAKQAAKASGEASGSSAKTAAKTAPQGSGSTSTPRRGTRQAENAPRSAPAAPRAVVSARTAGSVAGDSVATAPTRGGGGGGGGLRIFSHFGLQKPFAQFKITGANARCIATLRAFQTVIQDYVTPPNNTLARHLMTHISPQISHLVAARPMSVTMGNAIRQLKLDISGSDIDLPEQDAKNELCLKIDNYIRDRIDAAGEVIVEKSVGKIKDGDVILTYASRREGSSESSFAKSQFLSAGKATLRVLAEAGIPCTYVLLPSLGAIITEVDTIFLGAHSIHANGAVYSRAGTALVAMLAKQHSVPVVVCCETYKYSDGVQLDSFTKNELAPLGERFANFPLTTPHDSLVLRNAPNLEVLNPLYDLTPPANVTAVVTEVGIIPPDSISAIPVALGRLL
ncbi:hypothetical protein NM688_g5336 [Phlebia brevispora]|uniref:Uncharacterized protein n=1 Tax=Phlebia brevispora TaxID=194682 RepID=A0ACC1SX81_9APHY|nr:hypothetical protein NM688_g5336 [Phlebia brevispora]